MTEDMLFRLFRHLPAACAVHKLVSEGEKLVSNVVFVEANAAFEQITGLKMEAHSGRCVEEIFQEDAAWRKVYQEALSSLERGEGNSRVEIQGRWYMVKAFPLDEENFVLFLSDVTHEIQSLEELERQKETIEHISADLEIIFNSTQDAMFLVACEGDRFVYLRNNRTHQEMTGIGLGEIVGKEPEEILKAETARSVIQSYQQCIQAGTSISLEETLAFQGAKRDWLLKLVPVRENGEIKYLVGSRTDITEVKRLRKDREVLLRRLEAMFSGHAAVMLLINPASGRILKANPAAREFYGYSVKELVSMHIQEINMLPKEKVKRLMEEAESGDGHFLFPHRLKSGEIRMVDVFSCPIRFDGNSELFSIIVDVTDRENYRRAVQEEKELLNVTLRSIGDGVLTTDNGGLVTSLNKAATEITGWPEAEALGKPFTDIMQLKNEETGLEVENPISLVLRSGKIIGLANHTVLIRKNGESVPIADSAAPIVNAKGECFGVVMVFRDVAREQEQQNRIRYLSYHDALTGLYNRRFFDERMRVMDVSRYLPLSIVMGDVNGLKITNDVFGHEAGDRLLRKVADTFRENCRENDVITRWGGDEFLILLPETPESAAKEFIDRLRACFQQKREGSLQVSVSLGFSVKNQEEESLLSVLREAEERMYHQKLLESATYRNSIVSTLLSTLHEKSLESDTHAERMEKYTCAMGKALNMTTEELSELSLLSVLHDIGKVGIRQSILCKPGPLTPQEWDEMKRHCEIGYRIAQNAPELAGVAELILSHHEHWDGKGYPRNLKGKEIPIYSRIVAVADAFDAMTTDRPYRKTKSREEAKAELEKCAGTQFDPELVKIFIESMKEPGEILLPSSRPDGAE